MPYTSFAAHNIVSIRASTTGTAGAPLTLTLEDKDQGQASITIFTDNQTVTNDFMQVINRIAVNGWKPVPADPFRLVPDDYRE